MHAVRSGLEGHQAYCPQAWSEDLPGLDVQPSAYPPGGEMWEAQPTRFGQRFKFAHRRGNSKALAGSSSFGRVQAAVPGRTPPRGPGAVGPSNDSPLRKGATTVGQTVVAPSYPLRDAQLSP